MGRCQSYEPQVPNRHLGYPTNELRRLVPCFGAVGTDTGGSIRVPSGCCGLTGIKPTWGRVSRFGVLPLAESLDCVGPIARSAIDAAVILGIIAGSSPRSIYPVSLRFTALFNVGGNPAISFPAGFSSSGLPVGMQLAGPHLADELLLRTVHVFQKSTEWHGCHPLG
jgi:Asp-tRNA(Asn)/Glu-tRNA(Gln) amidotransferase A subunit family amidase